MSNRLTLIAKKNINFIYLQSFFGNGFFDRAIFMLYLSTKGYSLWEIGLLQSIVNLSMFILEIPSGLFADRFGKKMCMILGRVMFILYFIGMLLSHNFYMFGLTFFLLGLGATLLSGAEDALMYDSAEKAGLKNRYNKIAGKNIALITLVLAIAMGAGGFIAQISWSLVFIISLAFQLIALIFVLLLKDIVEIETSTKKSFSLIIKDSTSFLKMNKQVQLLIASISLFIGVSSIYFLFAQNLFQGQGIETQTISAIFAIVSLACAFVSERTYMIVKHFTTKKVLLFIVISSTVLYGMLAIKSLWISIPVFVLLNILFYAFSPIALTMIQDEIPSKQRATLLSVMSLLSSVVMFIIAPLIGYMTEWMSIELFFSLIGGFSSILVWYGLRQYLINVGKIFAENDALKGGEKNESKKS